MGAPAKKDESLRKGVEISIAMADAASQADVDVVAAYPITPQTHIVEHLSEVVANGELDAEFVPVESEHSAMSACCGSSAAGARTYTATASQGLALMSEILYIASAMRLPIVMAVANRALSAPISIWNDHGDVMAQRDTGWIQVFVENGQEAYDMTYHAFRVAEDKNVLLPYMLNFDGFIMSHVIEPITYWPQEKVKEYLPDYEPQMRLDVENPVTMGPVGIPEIYAETRWAHEHALRDSKKVIIQAWEEMEKITGRRYRPVESYRCEDADVRLLTMGALSETAMTAIDKMRDDGIKVGLHRIRLWRPFPYEELKKELSGCKVLGVVDRALSTGGPGGPVASEIKSAFYDEKQRPQVIEFIAGIGGRDVRVEDFEEMANKARKVSEGAEIPPFELVGVRE
jgi:pyruvate ferredoxin oxidoreductase alpha subunit